MENKFIKFLKLDKLTDSISKYLEARLELFKLEAKEEIAKITSKGIQAVMIIFLLSFALLFLSIAGCIFLSIWLDSYGMGFLIGGGFYLILGLFLILLGDKMGIKEKINKYLVTNIDSEDE